MARWNHKKHHRSQLVHHQPKDKKTKTQKPRWTCLSDESLQSMCCIGHASSDRVTFEAYLLISLDVFPAVSIIIHFSLVTPSRLHRSSSSYSGPDACSMIGSFLWRLTSKSLFQRIFLLIGSSLKMVYVRVISSKFHRRSAEAPQKSDPTRTGSVHTSWSGSLSSIFGWVENPDSQAQSPAISPQRFALTRLVLLRSSGSLLCPFSFFPRLLAAAPASYPWPGQMLWHACSAKHCLKTLLLSLPAFAR